MVYKRSDYCNENTLLLQQEQEQEPIIQAPVVIKMENMSQLTIDRIAEIETKIEDKQNEKAMIYHRLTLVPKGEEGKIGKRQTLTMQ